MPTYNRIITIDRHIMETQRASFPEASGDFSRLLMQIALTGKIISTEVNKAGLLDILGDTGATNVQGEEVQKLDEFANETVIRMMDHIGMLCAMASEEEENVIRIPKAYENGDYVLNFDPLDGSSNIDVNVSIGTIFSIHRRITKEGEPGTLEDCTQKGSKQVCAGYILYGSSTMLVYTTGNGVHGFTLDPSVGEFLLSHPDIKVPAETIYYSINESNFDRWDIAIRKYVSHIKQADPTNGRPYGLRYIGSLVADFHRNLLRGGVFLYPNDTKNSQGKLRLLYEAAPLAMIAEQAGGAASNGKQNILDIEPSSLHQRVPLYIGSKKDIEEIESFIRKYGA
jgi:fructose-1,6-bisphosphatase I